LDEAVAECDRLISNLTTLIGRTEKLSFIARYKNISKDDTGFQSQSTTTDN